MSTPYEVADSIVFAALETWDDLTALLGDAGVSIFDQGAVAREDDRSGIWGGQVWIIPLASEPRKANTGEIDVTLRYSVGFGVVGHNIAAQRAIEWQVMRALATLAEEWVTGSGGTALPSVSPMIVQQSFLGPCNLDRVPFADPEFFRGAAELTVILQGAYASINPSA